MQFEGRRRFRHGPNLTPLIDAVFLLLVFFMLTSHFVRDQSLQIALPEAESAAELNDDGPVEVALAADGTLSIDGQDVAADALIQQLRQLLAKRPQKLVTLRGDRAANLGAAVQVLDAARQAGAASVDVVARQP